LLKQPFLPLSIAGMLVATLPACRMLNPQTEISQYRAQMVNGVEQAFASVDGSSRASSGTRHKEHFVAPDGKLSNDGSSTSPWNLTTALSHPKSVKPGDIIWLRSGTYNGSFVSDLIGNKGEPIIVRQYPGERATIDGCSTPPNGNATLLIKGEFTWYWGFEVTNCKPERVTTFPGSDPPDMYRGTGVDVRGTDIKLINLIIHDTGGGIGAWISAKRAELSGNIVYYNGFDGPDRGHGHGIYIQNQLGPKHLLNNVVFDQFGSGIHAYGEAAPVSTLHVEGNILFANGLLSAKSGFSRNLLIGSLKQTEQLTVQSNNTYYPLTGGGANVIGYGGGACRNVSLIDNYLAGPDSFKFSDCTELRIHGNMFAGSKPGGFASFTHPDNVIALKPTGVFSDLKIDHWEPGRAYVVVYNWDHKTRIQLDISKLAWSGGQRYRLRSVENLFGDSVSGVFDGETLEIPMVGWTVAKPVGMQPPPSMLPEFGVFVLEPMRQSE
jgi:hypothetical protein